jgi:hypothetical protein
VRADLHHTQAAHAGECALLCGHERAATLVQMVPAREAEQLRRSLGAAPMRQPRGGDKEFTTAQTSSRSIT